MKLNEIATLSQVAQQYDVPLATLQYRLRFLEEDVDYRKLEGKRQPILLSPEGIKNITKSYKKL